MTDENLKNPSDHLSPQERGENLSPTKTPTRVRLHVARTSPLKISPKQVISNGQKQTKRKGNWECQQCKKTFTRGSTLKNHLRKHFSAEQYRCPYKNQDHSHCYKTFTEKGNCLKHISQLHGFKVGSYRYLEMKTLLDK